MPLIYYDKYVIESKEDRHPGFTLDLNHPCVRMVRECIGGKPVFHWTRMQALAIYNWYIRPSYRISKIEDEFGDTVDKYDFEELLKKSYYLIDGHPSKETVIELGDSVKMQEILEEENKGAVT
jgi:hypothetical protein